MKLELKDYQLKAVDELKQTFHFFIKKNSSRSLIFKAPTGSGKTIIISSFIENLCKSNEIDNVCFIWASIGKGELQIQSYDNVSFYLEGFPKCSLLDNEFFGTRNFIEKNEVVFINWEKLIQKDSKSDKWINNLMKEQESKTFLDVIEETKNRGTKIILIIDESHIGKGFESRIFEFKNFIIKPDFTIEMSATPLVEPDIEVSHEDVIKEGMIKHNLIVNEGILKNKVDRGDLDSEILILTKGFDKRKELLEKYKSINSKVNPLVLIQIPNKDEGQEKIRTIINFLKDKNVSAENGKLKIWLTGKEHNFDKRIIKNNQDITEFLIFKTAVATGWDCPRAQILIKFRDSNSETFETQTIGRILRTAEARSYNDHILDNAFIFTNLSNFETKKSSYKPNRIKTETSKYRVDKNNRGIYSKLGLKSYYISRQDNYNSADSGFYEIFHKNFKDFFGIREDEIILDRSFLQTKGFKYITSNDQLIIKENQIKSNWFESEKAFKNESVNVVASESDIYYAYYNFIKSNLNGLAYVRSKSSINVAIVQCIDKYFEPIERSIKIVTVQKLVLNNIDIFSSILNKSTIEYRKILGSKFSKNVISKTFEIEPFRFYSKESSIIYEAKKSLYDPLYLEVKENTKVNKLETAFIDFLEKNSQYIDWYWKNGSEDVETNFGLLYNSGLNRFLPDFIIKFKDGRVGIFDTKGINYNVDDTKTKAEALQKYIVTENENRNSIIRSIIGGIVVSTDYEKFLFNDNIIYEDFEKSRDDWKEFVRLFR
jgi:type III restriction enzyme